MQRHGRRSEAELMGFGLLMRKKKTGHPCNPALSINHLPHVNAG